MATIKDLMAITGLGRQAVTRAIDEGTLPGYRVGPNRVWISDEALEEVRKGTWVPPHLRKEEPKTNPFIRKRP